MLGVDKAALDQQAHERRSKEAQELAELRAFAQQAAHMDSLLSAAHQANQQQRRALNQGIDSYRRLQVANKSEMQARERHMEQAANLAEQQAALRSPWLNEDPRVEQSALNPHRVRRDHWKGMSDDQLKSIQETQAQQVIVKAQQQQEEVLEKQAYDTVHLSFARISSRQAAEAEAAKRQEARRLAGELQQQMAEKQERDRAIDRLYTNPPSADYFGQFGTSHR